MAHVWSTNAATLEELRASCHRIKKRGVQRLRVILLLAVLLVAAPAIADDQTATLSSTDMHAADGGGLGIVQVTLTLSPASLRAALLTEVRGVGPGKSLANQVELAQTYCAVPDVQATCAVLTGFVNEVQAQNAKKIGTTLDAKILSDADAIKVAIGCN